MNGRIIPTILGKGHDFQKLGHHPLFWPFMVHLGTTMAPMGVSFIQYVKMSTYWGLRSNESQLVHHLGPRWFSCTLYISTPSVNDEEFNSKNTCLILGWRKSSFGSFCKMLWRHLEELVCQSNIYLQNIKIHMYIFSLRPR